MNIDAIVTLVFNFFLLFKRITAAFNVQFCCFAGNMSSRSHFLLNWWTNSTDEYALAFVSRFLFGIITNDVKFVKNEKPIIAARVNIKSDLIHNPYDDKFVGKERPNVATSCCKAALIKELQAIDLQFSLMDVVMDKISFIVDDLSQSVGKQTIHCVTKPAHQQAASIKKPLKPPSPYTILPVKQPNPCTDGRNTSTRKKQLLVVGTGTQGKKASCFIKGSICSSI